jgi:hypothetical protein
MSSPVMALIDFFLSFIPIIGDEVAADDGWELAQVIGFFLATLHSKRQLRR